MKNQMKHIAGMILCISIIAGCSDTWLIENPPHLISGETLYTNLAGFEAGLNGMYAKVREEKKGTDGANYMRADIMLFADNLVPNFPHGYGQIAVDWGNLNNTTSQHYFRQWNWLYSVINAANTIIIHAEENDQIDWTGGGKSVEQNKNRVIAEAKALRAWAYRHLTFLWGDVPLNLNESKGSNIKTDWVRTPVNIVRDQIKSDLLYAVDKIGVEPSLQGRITKGAVMHYLAELYLVFNKPDSAFYWADRCINTPEYKLITQRYGANSQQPGVVFMDMFAEGNINREEGNSEALWVFQYEYNVIGGDYNITRRVFSGTFHHTTIVVNSIRPLQITMDRGGRGISRLALNKFAIELYEPADDRGSHHAIRKFYVLQDAIKNAPSPADLLPRGMKYGDTIRLSWTNDLTTASNRRINWPHTRKWDHAVPEDVQINGSYKEIPYLRLAETYLIKAEAQMLLGDLPGAANTINVIRRRANASEISPSDVNVDFILDERSRELVTEEHRRYTLLRTGKFLERVKKFNKSGGQTASERELLYPIPQVIIDANLTLKMEQNPLY